MSSPALGPPLLLIVLLLTPAASLAAGTATAPAPLPGLLTKDRPAWRALLHWPASCDQGGKVTPWLGWEENAGISVEPFPSGRRLVQVACHGGAYQAYYLLYLVDNHRGVTGPLVLPLYMARSNLLGLPRATHPTQRLDKPTLVRQAKIRGSLQTEPGTGTLTICDSQDPDAGNCGFCSTFKLSGTRFVPVEARAKLACNGNAQWSKLPLP